MVGRPGRSRGARVGVALAAVAGLVVALGGPVAGGPPVDGAAPEATSTLAGANGPIAFERSVPTPLTDDPAADLFADWSPDGTRIAFVSTRAGGDPDLYVMDADGSDVTALTDTPEPELGPAWSPDGTQIAFERASEAKSDVFVVDADGTDVQRLTDDPETDAHPRWSPDGTQIAFTSQRDGTPYEPNDEVYVMDADGSDEVRLTDQLGFDGQPDWSPDGTRLVFVSGRDGGLDLYTMDPDGTDVARSTTTDADEHWPRWSPDGDRLLATRYTPGEPYAPLDVELWTTAVDGGDATPLTDSEEESWRGSWSPDGTAVAFDRFPSFPAEGDHEVYLLQLDGSGNRELFAMAPDGTEREQLTDHPATDEDPAWSPDGELVAFVSDRTGAPALHVLDPRVGSTTRLTHDDAGDLSVDADPAWSPDATVIAFSTDRDALGTAAGRELYLTDLAGGLTRLTDDGYEDAGPAWSPDGERLAYASTRGANTDVWVVDADGSDPVRLTTDPATDHEPTWSPDGSQIAFRTDREGDGDVYVMAADGSDQQRLTDAVGDHGAPAWSPDGQRVAFSSRRGGPADLWTVAMDGGDEQRLTFDGQLDDDPDWAALPPFTDVPRAHPFYDDITWMAAQGVSTGYPDGTFRPAAVVTRQAMSAFLYRLAGEPAFTAPEDPTFADVPVGHAFFVEVEWMAATGISTGYPGGTYRPAAVVTRQAMSAFLYRLAGEPEVGEPVVATFSDVAVDAPFFAEVEWMAATGISTGYPGGTYRPAAPVTRQAMSAFLHRLADGPGVGV